MSAAAELVLPMTDDGEVRIRTITDFHEFDSLESEWDALVEASGTTHPFIAHTWLRAWWSAFGAGKAMRIAIARKGGTLVGAAPLMLTVLAGLMVAWVGALSRMLVRRMTFETGTDP